MPIIAVKRISETVFKAPISPPILIIKKTSSAGTPINSKKNEFICLIQNYIINVYLSNYDNNFGYIDIILLGMIAGFIILRLRNILGRKTGHETKIYPAFEEKKFNIPNGNVTSFKQNLNVLEGQEKKEFLKGAEIAYETILTSFADGDNKKLRSLLTPEMASNFEQAIQARNKENIKSEFTFIGIKESNVEKYEKIKNELFASVKFVSEVISVKKDKDDKIIEGNPDKIKLVTDYWKFTKNILKKGPNWYLSEIVSK